MTDKEFRRLSRKELIDIIFALQKREKEYQTRLAAAEQKLQDKQIILDKAGSIAEAALGLNQVFASAQAAADQYVTEVTRMRSQAQQEAQKIIAQAQKQAQTILANAKAAQGAQPAAKPEETKNAKLDEDIYRRWTGMDLS